MKVEEEEVMVVVVDEEVMVVVVDEDDGVASEPRST